MARALPDPVDLVPLAEAARRLGVTPRTFRRHWQGVFTPRTACGKPPSAGRPRRFLADELAVAAAEGREAVLTYRMAKRRLAAGEAA